MERLSQGRQLSHGFKSEPLETSREKGRNSKFMLVSPAPKPPNRLGASIMAMQRLSACSVAFATTASKPSKASPKGGINGLLVALGPSFDPPLEAIGLGGGSLSSTDMSG